MPDESDDSNHPKTTSFDVHRTRLLQMREELLGLSDAGEEQAGTVVLDQSRVGRLSRMDAMANQAMSQETQRRRVFLLKQIDVALAKMEKNQYGECDECLEPINPDRLALNPATALCIVCANAAEN